MNARYPLLIDGGLSNVLENQGHDLNHSLWTARLLETNPESIIQAHYSYIESGAQCITTSSYQASIDGFISVGYSRDKAETLIRQTVELADIAIERAMEKGLVDHRPLIAASIGPYGAYLADGSEYKGHYGISDDVLREFHLERIGLLDGSKADFYACETIPSLQEALVLSEILKQTDKPAWISFSCMNERQVNDGTGIGECASVFANHSNVFALGVNCTAPKYVSGIIEVLKAGPGAKRIVVYPNSGEAYHAESKTWLGLSDPDLFVAMTREWIRKGADIIGGCCRIGPDHIGRIRDYLMNVGN